MMMMMMMMTMMIMIMIMIITAVLYTKFQNDWTIETNGMDERGFTRFDV